ALTISRAWPHSQVNSGLVNPAGGGVGVLPPGGGVAVGAAGADAEGLPPDFDSTLIFRLQAGHSVTLPTVWVRTRSRSPQRHSKAWAPAASSTTRIAASAAFGRTGGRGEESLTRRSWSRTLPVGGFSTIMS